MLVSNKALSGSVTPVSPVSRGPSRTTSLKPSLSRFAKATSLRVRAASLRVQQNWLRRVAEVGDGWMKWHLRMDPWIKKTGR